MRVIFSDALRNFAVLCFFVTLGGAIAQGGHPFIAGGRLTDLSCYILIGVTLYAFLYVWTIDYRVRKGLVQENTLPFWLRNN